MYFFWNYELKQLNIVTKLSGRQGIDNNGIHWLNPLSYKCDERFTIPLSYPLY